MQIIKIREFDHWARAVGITDKMLKEAVAEIEKGLIDARLGGGLLKKRVALSGKGKSGGSRTIMAYRKGEKAFFIYGFEKNAQSNIKPAELKALKKYSKILLSYDEKNLKKAFKDQVLVEIK